MGGKDTTNGLHFDFDYVVSVSLLTAANNIGKSLNLRAFFGRSSYKVKAGEVTYVLEKCVSEVQEKVLYYDLAHLKCPYSFFSPKISMSRSLEPLMDRPL